MLSQSTSEMCVLTSETVEVATDPEWALVLMLASRIIRIKLTSYLPRQSSMVSAIDEGIGQIYQALQQHGLADNTIILFSTDNGGAPAAGGFNYPYRGQKATLYEGGFKTPAILHVPGAVRYSPLYQNTIHLADFAPTLLGIVDRTVGDTAGLGLYEELGQDIDGQDHTLWMFQSVGGGQSTTSVVQ
jgi:arylsulfatase A-like enzyme